MIIEILESLSENIKDFDETIFDNIVEKIIAHDSKTIEFVLINGLVLKERL